MSFELLLSFNGGGDTIIRLFQNDTANYHKIIIPNKQISAIAMDPNNWNLDATANISVNLAEINKEMHFSLFPSTSCSCTCNSVCCSANRWHNSMRSTSAQSLIPVESSSSNS